MPDGRRLVAAPQVRRHVQQLHRDHLDPPERRAPEREAAAMPMLAGRLVQGSAANGLLERGKVLIPEISRAA
jgi:hypothetical protein